ncbi:hypothetical protein HWV23_01530 [Natronomonas halophila]|uniref:group I intron-associated PD-(D/E)XK endonuclease n=1 Tax=Natronomonas halophila TaxID=2747817 RepID=UPI0015B6CFE3|nr:group I intron-associated PD-(D/E)XK endonuclease [Natronomonas halophila]QLD84440.1 hypothetical protein HWV23_01530 [Natronomonas halophila]
MNTKQRGDITEAIAVAELKRMGFTVSTPVGETSRYDLIVDTGNDLLRIQCKTGWMTDDGALVFKACSTEYNTSGHHANRSYDGEIDAFLIRQPETDALYFIPIEDAPSREMTLRLDGEANQRQNDASEYRLSESLATAGE